MITIPGIEDCLCVGRYQSGLVEGRLGMVSLPSGMDAKWLEINNSAGLAIFLCTCNHPMAPCDRFTYRSNFNDTQADISIWIYFDLLVNGLVWVLGSGVAVVSAAESIINFMGGLSIISSDYCSHVLKVLDL